MQSFLTVFDSRASLLLSALFVTWIAFGLLGVVTAHLHLRLRRLEARPPTGAAPGARTSFARLLGSDGAALFGRSTAGPTVHLLLSRRCRSCAHVLDELVQGGLPGVRTAVAWIDGAPDAAARLPADVEVLDAGPDVAQRVGVRVTPFAIVTDDQGTVVDARAVTSVADLRRVLPTPVRDPELPVPDGSDLQHLRWSSSAQS